MMMKKYFVLCLFILPSVCLALLPAQFSANFESIYKSKSSGKEKSSKGTLVYQRPSKIRFEVSEPDALTFVSDGSKSWYYRPPFIEGEAGELRIGDANKLGILRVFDLLVNDLVDNKDFKVKNAPGKTILNFDQKISDHDIKHATILFKDEGKKFEQMDKIELSFKDGKTSTIVFKDLKASNSNDPSTFVFMTPENTNIIK